tara:strand:- start:3763 stop:4299 length:537 start_codon:yes stop_codon:yes gene_type:complete
MACSISAGRLIDCKDTVGGIKAVYISTSTGVDFPNSSGFADSADVITTTGALMSVYKFELVREKSSFTITLNSDYSTGTYSFDQALSLSFQKFDSTDIAEILALAKGLPAIWVEDNNGNNFLLGAGYGMALSGGNIVSGAGFADENGFTLEFSGKELNPVYMTAGPLATATPIGLTIL